MMQSENIRYLKLYDKDHNELASYDMDSNNSSVGIVFAATDDEDAVLLTASMQANAVMSVAQHLIEVVGQEINMEPIKVGFMIMEAIFRKQSGGKDNDKESK